MLEKIIKDSTIKKIREQIGYSKNIIIVSHISPDGDAIGSSLALYHFLSQFKPYVQVLMPNNFPTFFQWMDGSEKIVIGDYNRKNAKKLIEEANLIFCLDFNNLCRIGFLEQWIKASNAKKILIDHHLSPEKFCDIKISYPEISSTSELIFRFIDQMEMLEKMNHSCAECIYTGIMTDTGIFTYNTVQISLYSIIQKLLTKGINRNVIYNKVYNHYSEERIRLQGYLLYKKMKILKKYHTALIVLSYEEQKRFKYKKGDTDGFVNIPLTIKKILFSVFFREEEKRIKLSFRSKGSFPTNQFASEVFMGGGHLNASGGEFEGTLEGAINLFESALSKYKQWLVIPKQSNSNKLISTNK